MHDKPTANVARLFRKATEFLNLQPDQLYEIVKIILLLLPLAYKVWRWLRKKFR